jgi:hypothetical protein
VSLDIWRLLVTVIVAALAGGGITGLALLPQRRRMLVAQAQDASATADSRIMSAAAGLVEQTGAQLPFLIERITRLEADRDRLGGELGRLRVEQDAERDELAQWRSWGAQQRRWSEQAVTALKGLGVEIPDPPTPPHYLTLATT